MYKIKLEEISWSFEPVTDHIDWSSSENTGQRAIAQIEPCIRDPSAHISFIRHFSSNEIIQYCKRQQTDYFWSKSLRVKKSKQTARNGWFYQNNKFYMNMVDNYLFFL